MQEHNPYMAPSSPLLPGELSGDPDEGRGVWRDGPCLVMSRYATLPSRCIKCNQPATNRLTRKVSTHHPGLFLLWLVAPLGLLVYLVLLFIERRSATIAIPLCQGHRDRRSRAVAISWCLSGLGLATLLIGMGYETLELPMWMGDEVAAPIILSVSGITMLVFGVISALSSARIVSAPQIDKKYVWLKKVGPASE